MRRTLVILAVATLSFILGAGSMYLLKRQPKVQHKDWQLAVYDDEFRSRLGLSTSSD
jgi:hypothetical protein